MKKVDVNIHAFTTRFDSWYNVLYDNDDNVAGYDEAVDAFDRAASDDRFAQFVGEFARYRGDLITSDREAAAFMFALASLTA